MGGGVGLGPRGPAHLNSDLQLSFPSSCGVFTSWRSAGRGGEVVTNCALVRQRSSCRGEPQIRSDYRASAYCIKGRIAYRVWRVQLPHPSC